MTKKQKARGRSRRGSARKPGIKPVHRELPETTPDDPRPGITITDHRVRTVVKIIFGSPGQEHSVDELARSVNLSSSRLRHLFKEETGLAPSHFRRMVRMNEARTLLETTFLTIQEICNKVGLTGYATFSRAFRKTFGMTPSEHRKSHFADRDNPRNQA